MTLEEFHAQVHNRPCIGCGHLPVETRLEPNNNGTYIACPKCGRKHAWSNSVLYLKVSTAKRRDEYPDGHSLREVWDRYGQHCFVCGLTEDELTALRIGRERHHTQRYAEHGHDGGWIVPVCGKCHAFVTAIQAFVRALLKQTAGASHD